MFERIANLIRPKKPVYPVVEKKDQIITTINSLLLPCSFLERDEIIQAAIRSTLPRKHMKYRPGQERYA